MDKKAELISILKKAYYSKAMTHGYLPQNPNVAADMSKLMVWEDPTMSASEKLRINGIIAGGARDAGVGRTGMLSAKNLAYGALGAGFGYGAATFTGKALSALFGLPTGTQKALQFGGAAAGFLRATGVI